MGDTYIRRADLLIKAAKKLKQKRDDFEIWIVGNKGELSKNLENLASKLELEKTVKFYGRVSDEKLAELHSKSLSVVHLVKEAPFGNIVTEAMACGTPVAAFPVNGPIDIINLGVSGFQRIVTVYNAKPVADTKPNKAPKTVPEIESLIIIIQTPIKAIDIETKVDFLRTSPKIK